ncbi:MAG: hypothetical protein M1816_001132 [Peltula sp. TS41687]|nr:MAG: hypothetical protein M1816_001132 [Peltula sp. TS41687]
MVAARATERYRRSRQGQDLSKSERETLIRSYLPTARSDSPGQGWRRRARSKPIRTFLKTQLYLLSYEAIQILFSVYLWFRQTYHALLDLTFSMLYYHHRTPELIERDVKALGRLPDHLSVILTLRDNVRAGKALETLMDEAAEIVAWCAAAGIPTLSVYEKSGLLKSYIPQTHRAMASKLGAYFGTRRPSLQLGAPHVPSYLNGDRFPDDGSPPLSYGHLSVLLVSAEDGRESLVDLTKTLAEMSQRDKLSIDDISIDLVDVELTDNIMGEPDLLILFGPYVELQGYPPWQIRLTEIFHMQDNRRVGYQVFLRALHSYAKAHMRFGR